MSKLLFKFIIFCVFYINCVLTIYSSNDGIKTKTFHHDPHFSNTPYGSSGHTAPPSTHNSRFVQDQQNFDRTRSTITFNQATGSTNRPYQNNQQQQQGNFYNNPNRVVVQGQSSNIDAVYVENNIVEHRSECPPGATGQFPYMYDCRRFLNCWKGRGFIQACAPGTVFNPISLECDSPKKVNCLGVSESERANQQQQQHSAKLEETTNYGTESRRSEVNDMNDADGVACTPGFSGLQPHPFVCEKFLNCDHGRTFVQECGPGTVFNPLYSVCDYPHKVNCRNQQGSTVVDNYPSGSNIHFNIEPSYNENLEENQNQQTYRNPKQYNNDQHPYSTTSTPTPTYSHQHQGHHSGYPHPHRHPSQYPGASTQTPTTSAPSYHHHIGHHSGYPHPHRHPGQSSGGSTQTTIPIWQPVPPRPSYPQHYGDQQGAPNTNVHRTYSGIIINETTTTGTRPDPNQNSDSAATWHHQPRPPYRTRGTTTRPPPIFNNDGRRQYSPQYPDQGTSSTPTDKSYDISQASVHRIIPNNTLDNNPSGSEPKTTIYYAVPVEYDSNEVFGNRDTTTTRPLPPPPSYDLHHEHDNQKHIPFTERPSSTTTRSPPTTTTFKPIYNFGGITGGDIPAYNPYYNGKPRVQPEPRDLHYAGSENRNINYDGDDDTKNTPTSDPPPIYSIDARFHGIPIPPNHLMPPLANHPNPTPESKTFDPTHIHSVENKTNVRIYPNYPPIKTDINTQQQSHHPQHNPSYSPSYSGVANSRDKPYDQTFLESHLPLAPPIKTSFNNNRQVPPAQHTTITFNRDNDLDQPHSEESQIVPIYVRPTQPSFSPITPQIHTKSGSLPHGYNHQYYYNNPTPSTPQTNLNRPTKEIDPDIEDLPLNEALKMLLRPYASQKDNVTDESVKLLESHIAQIETTQAKEKLKKQVEIIVTGEQDYLNNQPDLETSASNRQPHHIAHNPTTHTTKLHPKDKNNTHSTLPIPSGQQQPHQTVSYQPNVPIKRPNPDIEEFDSGQKLIPLGSRSSGNIPDAGTKKSCAFDCGNGKCVKEFEVCDGVNNCGNRKDEASCDHLGYEVRLVNESSNKHMGRIEVKVNGNWGYICDDKFDLNDANVVCRELGFEMGASEVRGNSYYLPKVTLMSSYNNVSFVMDELDCVGNETSLRHCDFKGWGVNDCNADEVVGVVCKIPIIKCPHDYWLCKTSMECIPPNFVCDNTVDCGDKTDESDDVCKSKIEYRLINGKTRLEGRVEVKYRNEWGTICDDDFGQAEALVVCKTLGYHGQAEVIKNTYGAGFGPIWLDQVSCFGNETCLDQCTHWKWGENNCNHSEDVSIRCSVGSIRPVFQNSIKNPPNRHTEMEEDEADDLDYLFYNTRSSKLLDLTNKKPKCGYFNPNILDEEFEERQLQRIIHGNVAKLGRHPWQATIRVKGVDGISSHLCGAVLISSRHLLTAAHCISDYEKGAFFIRLGDHRTDRTESYEKDVFIHDWYIHENYRKINHMNNDIAMIVIKDPVQFNDYIQPICLPNENAKYDAQKMCTISGWGSDKTGESAPSKILRAAEVPILSNEVCKKPEVYGRHITEGMFCAGFLDGKFDACDGDSGGPMACTDGDAQVLYGITSWGLRCGFENKPGVYVKISEYVEWIKRKINHSIISRRNKK